MPVLPLTRGSSEGMAADTNPSPAVIAVISIMGIGEPSARSPNIWANPAPRKFCEKKPTPPERSTPAPNKVRVETPAPRRGARQCGDGGHRAGLLIWQRKPLRHRHER